MHINKYSFCTKFSFEIELNGKVLNDMDFHTLLNTFHIRCTFMFVVLFKHLKDILLSFRIFFSGQVVLYETLDSVQENDWIYDLDTIFRWHLIMFHSQKFS